MLRRGNAGRARVPGKHGAAPAVYETVTVLIGDQPGELARIFADAGRAGVNIEDVRIEHATNQQAGLIQLMVERPPHRAWPRPSASAAGRSGSRPGERTGGEPVTLSEVLCALSYPAQQPTQHPISTEAAPQQPRPAPQKGV
ncbi:hypothetical protein ACFQ2B_25390 [Streptomyces stramineus]